MMDFPSHEQGHSHSHAHIIIPIKEPVHLTHDGMSYYLMPGNMSFILPYSYHTFSGKCHKDNIVMDIPETMIKKKDYAIFSANRILPISSTLMPVIELIHHEITVNPASDSVRYLFYYIYDKFVEKQSFRSLKYIAENFSENLTVAKLAEIENYNRFYYTDWFKSKTGILPSEYIQIVRIERPRPCWRIPVIKSLKLPFRWAMIMHLPLPGHLKGWNTYPPGNTGTCSRSRPRPGKPCDGLPIPSMPRACLSCQAIYSKGCI